MPKDIQRKVTGKRVSSHPLRISTGHELDTPRQLSRIVIDIGRAFVLMVTLIASGLGIATVLGLKLSISNLHLGLLTAIALLSIALIAVCYALAATAARESRLREALSFGMVNENRAAALPGALHGVVKESYDRSEYMDVVRLGTRLSRPLWLSARYRERLSIGALVEDAAGRSNQYYEQAAALIDDIGWTCVALGDVERAKKSILHGIQLAELHKYYYLSAKGNRHLAMIALQQSEGNSAATDFLASAMDTTTKITDDHERDEMTAGILFVRAGLHLDRKRYDEALDDALQARSIYEKLGDQEERLVKSYAQLGIVAEKKGQSLEAKDYYRKGLEMARHLDRKDEIARCQMALAALHISERNFELAVGAADEAVAVYEMSGTPKELMQARDLREKAEQGLSLTKAGLV